MEQSTYERRIREAAMAYLSRSPDAGSLVDYRWAAAFHFEGERVALLDAQRGIRKPARLAAALAIRTTFTPPGRTPPYEDDEGPDGLQRYKYRGTDPGHPENRALRNAMTDRLPLIWFVGIEPGRYQPIFPVYVVGEEPEQQQFVLALDESQRSLGEAVFTDDLRRYSRSITKVRLHQPVFRARVLAAYGNRCSLCSLRHGSLLDAAHIIPDGRPHGQAVVPNGLSMCKIHHAAYDADILGVSPDLVITVRTDVLAEVDGPMLRHGIQAMHARRLLVVPTTRAARPDRDRLAERYEEFLRT